MNLSELQNKDIVDIDNGKKIGGIIDARINPLTGQIEALIIESSKNFFAIKNSDIEISFNEIKKIGEDVILVKYNEINKKIKK